jgi:hypothetical protein
VTYARLEQPRGNIITNGAHKSNDYNTMLIFELLWYEIWCELYAIMLSLYDLFNEDVSVSDYIVEW